MHLEHFYIWSVWEIMSPHVRATLIVESHIYMILAGLIDINLYRITRGLQLEVSPVGLITLGIINIRA